jgi:hypothetical protein
MDQHLLSVINENRAWYGHTVAELSRQSGVTYSHLANIVRGVRGASVETWERLLNVYGLTLSVTSKR